jgi:hypothetical protein
VNAEILKDVALRYAGLAGLNHLALFVILVVVWVRRESASRVLSVYFAAAFATAAFALFSTAGARAYAVVAAALAALWCLEVTRGRLDLSFARTPRLRLVLMALAGAYAFSHPGYTAGRPPLFIFAPLGVLLRPTLLAATALLSATSARTPGPLHWTLAVAGLAAGGVGIATEGWIHVPLVAVSGYAVLLLLGRGGRLLPESEAPGPRSVREIRDRMYSRRSILPGPRDTRRPGRRVQIRRKR